MPPARSALDLCLMNQMIGLIKYFFFRSLYGKENYLRKLGVRIGNDCEILTPIINFGSEPWLVSIGDRVTITHGVKMVTHDASTRLFRARHPGMNRRFGNKFGPICIGSDVFVGVNSIILPGVTIGDNVVIGAGSVVNKDVRSGVVVAGVPAKELCTLQEYERKCVDSTVAINAQTYTELRDELTAMYFGGKK